MHLKKSVILKILMAVMVVAVFESCIDDEDSKSEFIANDTSSPKRIGSK